MSEDNKVVFLEFRNKETKEATEATQIACKLCLNRTWLIVHHDGGFPHVKCAACGQIAGRMGWANSE